MPLKDRIAYTLMIGGFITFFAGFPLKSLWVIGGGFAMMLFGLLAYSTDKGDDG